MLQPNPSIRFMTSPEGKSQEGTILLLVVIIIGLVFVIVADAGLVARVELEATRNADWELILEMALRGGYQVAEAHLREDLSAGDTDSLQDDWAQPEGIEFEFNPEEYGAGPFIEERNAEGLTSEREAQSVFAHIFIRDEDRKWPLNILTKGAEAQQKRRLDGLVSVIDSFREDSSFDVDAGQAQQYAELIYEFMKRPEDSQEGTYGPTPRPLTKTGSILRVTDLALIPRLPPDLFFDAYDEQNERIAPGLIHFLTPWSDLQVNVNTAPLAVLRGLFRRTEMGVGEDIFEARKKSYDEAENALPRDESGRRSENSASSSSSQRRSGNQREGSGAEDPEEDIPTGGWQTIDDISKDVRTLTTQTFNEARTMMSVSSHTFSIWVEVQRGRSGPKRIRRWVVRRNGAHMILILAEDVKYPWFRKQTEEERQEELDSYDDR